MLLDHNFKIFPTNVEDITKCILMVMQKYFGIYNIFNYKESFGMFEICLLLLKNKVENRKFIINKINRLKISYSYTNLLKGKKLDYLKKSIKKYI